MAHTEMQFVVLSGSITKNRIEYIFSIPKLSFSPPQSSKQLFLRYINHFLKD